jgi:hypothetical protein
MHAVQPQRPSVLVANEDNIPLKKNNANISLTPGQLINLPNEFYFNNCLKT